jgi:hypothetical protein
MHRKTLVLLAVLLVGASGCNKPKSSTFGGKISFRGQPVTSGVIFFIGPAPKLQMGMGTIRDDGTYMATDVPVGEVRVTVQAPNLPPTCADPDKSGLAFTISSAMTSLDIAIP